MVHKCPIRFRYTVWCGKCVFSVNNENFSLGGQISRKNMLQEGVRE